MEKFARSIISIEKMIQAIAIIGLIFFFGYLGFASLQTRNPDLETSPTPTLPRN